MIQKVQDSPRQLEIHQEKEGAIIHPSLASKIALGLLLQGTAQKIQYYVANDTLYRNLI